MNQDIIQSILDTDLYKLTMQNAVLQLFPKAKAQFELVNRGKTQFPIGFDKELKKQIVFMSKLALSDEEGIFLNEKCPFLGEAYVDFLRGYRFNPDEVMVTQRGGDLSVVITGPWYRTILWEVPLMAVISELYFRMTKQTGEDWAVVLQKAQDKGNLMRANGLKVADFGTRRRFSHLNQYNVVDTLKIFGKEALVGTSNVYIAMQLEIKPIGTMAHEWIQFHAAKYGFERANVMAMENWAKVYRGDLGIVLTDTFTTKDFFRVFDKFYAKLFDGVRHDSGDPFEFGEKVIRHYEKLGIDPMSKVIIFSDGLTVEKALEIAKVFAGRIKVSFGIGTSLSNDVGVKPLNIVIKMFEVLIAFAQEWTQTIKLSDVSGKNTGDFNTINLCKTLLGV